VSVDLVRVAAGLIVHTDAEDAKIFLDGDQIGIGQQVILDPAPAGRHELVVESETLGRWAEAIELKASKLATVDVALRGVMGALAVVTQPAGATVWLDGENVGVTPLDLTAVKPGNHSLRLTLDGHSEVWQALKITEGASARIENTLVAESGSLEVKPVPSGARVYVNGVELGTGRQQLANLKPGMYSVRASAAGYTDAIQPVAVDADKTAKLTVHLESFDGGGRLAGGSPTGKPVTKQPGFWIGIGAGGAAIVGGVITAVAIANANANPAPEPPTGVVAPTATTIIRLP
jgi:hypothetical protein